MQSVLPQANHPMTQEAEERRRLKRKRDDPSCSHLSSEAFFEGMTDNDDDDHHWWSQPKMLALAAVATAVSFCPFGEKGPPGLVLLMGAVYYFLQNRRHAGSGDVAPAATVNVNTTPNASPSAVAGTTNSFPEGGDGW